MAYWRIEVSDSDHASFVDCSRYDVRLFSEWRVYPIFWAVFDDSD